MASGRERAGEPVATLTVVPEDVGPPRMQTSPLYGIVTLMVDDWGTTEGVEERSES